MIRGTNAQFVFKLPYSFNQISTAKIMFWQPDNNGPTDSRPLPIIKILQQCSQSKNPNELCVTLNQEETLRFKADRKAYVQLRARTVDGIPVASKQQIITVEPSYDDSVLEDDILPTPDNEGYVYLDGKSIIYY
jgi:hypothetical protein